MQDNVIATVFLPIALGVIMLGLGLGLRVADFRRVVAYPRAVAIGLACQMLVLPLVCLGIAHAFALTPVFAVGLMLLAASPGGATANLFSHLAHGDVALNITLTAVNSLLSLITLPLIVSYSLDHFLGTSHTIPLPLDKLFFTLAVIVGPVAIGMVIRARTPGLAARLDKPVRLLSAAVLLVVILAAVFKDFETLRVNLPKIGPAALAFNLASLAVGYFVPRLARVERRQAIAIGMEIGIHNGALAIAIAYTVLGNEQMAIPPAIYGLLMFFTAAAFGYWVARRK